MCALFSLNRSSDYLIDDRSRQFIVVVSLYKEYLFTSIFNEYLILRRRAAHYSGRSHSLWQRSIPSQSVCIFLLRQDAMPSSINIDEPLLNEFLKKFSYRRVDMYRIRDVSTTVRLDRKEYANKNSIFGAYLLIPIANLFKPFVPSLFSSPRSASVVV